MIDTLEKWRILLKSGGYPDMTEELAEILSLPHVVIKYCIELDAFVD